MRRSIGTVPVLDAEGQSALAGTAAEVIVQLKPPPQRLFADDPGLDGRG